MRNAWRMREQRVYGGRRAAEQCFPERARGSLSKSMWVQTLLEQRAAGAIVAGACGGPQVSGVPGRMVMICPALWQDRSTFYILLPAGTACGVRRKLTPQTPGK
jgi:hypothetical protein